MARQGLILYLNEKKIVLFVAIALAIVALAVSLVLKRSEEQRRKYRPLFHNHWGFTDKGGLYREWHLDNARPIGDNILIFADFQWNMLWVFEFVPGDSWSSDRGKFTPDIACIRFVGRATACVTPSLNTATLFDKSGSRRESPIAPGYAKETFDTYFERDSAEILSLFNGSD